MSISEIKKIEKPYVFLSYSHDDADRVEIICAELENLGFNCWLDSEKIRPMEKYNDVIEEAIEECEVFLAFFSKSYVVKNYCQWEYDYALDKFKSNVVVCIDDANKIKETAGKNLFARYAGHSIEGYTGGVGSDKEELKAFAGRIAQSTQFEILKKHKDTGDEKYRPPVTVSEELVACVMLYTERQYHQKGNYAFESINPSLFATIEEIFDDGGRVHQKHKALAEHVRSDCDRKNIFLTGEGGNGKTVSLVSACETLISKGDCAVYIPARELCHYDDDIEKYIYEKIFLRSDSLMMHFKELLKLGRGEKEPHIIVMLDGANEIPSSEMKTIAFRIREKLLGLDVRFVISSRDDMRKELMLESFRHLQLQPLSSDAINSFLCEKGLTALDSKMLSVIRTPHLLTLYACAESMRDKYHGVKGIKLEENPDTPGKIMHNFFQTQLFRASEEVSFDYAEHLVLLEYLLPKIAFEMVKKDTLLLEKDDFFDCMEEAQDDIRYKWYSRDRLRLELDGLSFSATDENFDKLFNLARNSLHLICLGEGGYEFSHHTFRDYFAATFVANEIKAICRKSSRAQEAEPLLERVLLESEIIDFVSDILHEKDACPVFCDGWSFPGKTSVAPSEMSYAERVLPLWRERADEGARCAVYNLVSIMKSGRDKNLAFCDFSGLDMRALRFYGCQFVQWYKSDIYPSIFDRALLDRECFVNSGHDATVSAVCVGKNRIFSGNCDGEIRIYDTERKEWTKTISLCDDTVVHLVCNEQDGVFAAVYPHSIFVCRSDTCEIVKEIKNKYKSKSFRYAKYEGGRLVLSYDLEPLVYYTEEGERLPFPSEGFRFDVPARSADWAEDGQGFARCFGDLISVCVFDKKGKCRIHDSLKNKLSDGNFPRPDNKMLSDAQAALSGTKWNKRVASLEDSLYAVAIGNTLFDYDKVSGKCTQWRRFSEDISEVTSDGTNIFVSLRSSVVCLRRNFVFCDAFLDMNGASVSALKFHSDRKRLLIAAGHVLSEYDTESLSLVHRKVFPRDIVACACYTDDGVAVGVGTDIVVLDSDFSESFTLYGARIAPVMWIQKNYDGEGYYVISKNGEIKMMDDKLVVRRMRVLDGASKCVWGRDRLTGEIQLIFVKGKSGADSIRYSFERDKAEPLGWRYEFYEKEDGRVYSEKRIYKLDENCCLLMPEDTPPYRKIKYYNHMGVFIYGCSFRNVGGNIAQGENIDFIYRNGGLIGDNR